MSLMIIKEPKIQNAQNAGDLEPGTWFLNLEGQVSAILIDDRTFEKRVMMIGASHCPFIASQPVRTFKVSKILPVGTVLQIVHFGNFEEQPNA